MKKKELPQFKYLTKSMMKKLYQATDDMEDFVDINELESCKYNPNPYDVEPQLVGTSGCYEYDEDEMTLEEYKVLRKFVEADGLINYIDLTDELTEEQLDDENLLEELDKEAITYLDYVIEYLEG